MQVEINLDAIRQKKLFVATPMYGGMCTGQFASSFSQLVSKAREIGLHLQHHFMFNESLIQRARNYCVDEFLRSDCTHLMFIDADIGFSADDVLIMLNMMDTDSDYNVVCGPYPKKCISWEKIKAAVDKGVADENPGNLENYVGDFVINLDPKSGVTTVNLDAPFEIAEGGTGFMMIHRQTFERFAVAYPEKAYKPDHIRSEHFTGDRMIHAYFDCVIDPESKRYLSEDYFFCQYVRGAGMKVWMCPFFALSHTGSYTFGGTLGHLASIQVDPTAGQVHQRKIASAAKPFKKNPHKRK